MKSRSTEEVAELIGVTKVTLERWLAQGKVAMPEQVQIGSRRFRLWTDRDVQRVKEYKAAHYGKGKGPRKKKSH